MVGAGPQRPGCFPVVLTSIDVVELPEKTSRIIKPQVLLVPLPVADSEQTRKPFVLHPVIVSALWPVRKLLRSRRSASRTSVENR
jgi:hypothetical protein